MPTLLLARHGETDWNRDRRWQGSKGASLNADGRQQAHDLAARLDRVDAVYSSDAARAYETAVILASRHGLPVTTDPRLGEVDFGLWEGLTREEIDDRFAGGFARWGSGESSTPEGGESDAAMAERVIAALSEIAQRHSTDERVLVVTSGGPIRAAQAHVRGIDQARARGEIETVANCAFVEFVIDGDAWSIP